MQLIGEGDSAPSRPKVDDSRRLAETRDVPSLAEGQLDYIIFSRS